MRYEENYGMARTPFVRNIPSDQLYSSPSTEENLNRLRYVADNQMFAVVIAEPGCGKSTLLRKFNDSLSKDKYLLLYLSDSKLTPKWLYKGLLDQLGLEAGFYRGDAKRLLQKQLEAIHSKEHRKVVCILDEAHLLSRDTLEEFRFLLNSEFDSESQMALVLSGQPELWSTKLRYKRYTAIRQRIDVFCTINPLDRAETEDYIKANLKYAGCDHEIFTDTAVDEIYKVSNGIPRMINRVCERCLMYGAQQNKKLIDDHTIQFVSQHEFISAWSAPADNDRDISERGK